MFGKSWELLAQPPHLHGQHPAQQNQTTHPALCGKWGKLLEEKLLATKGLRIRPLLAYCAGDFLHLPTHYKTYELWPAFLLLQASNSATDMSVCGTVRPGITSTSWGGATESTSQPEKMEPGRCKYKKTVSSKSISVLSMCSGINIQQLNQLEGRTFLV